jgi:hypothetical protein
MRERKYHLSFRLFIILTIIHVDNFLDSLISQAYIYSREKGDHHMTKAALIILALLAAHQGLAHAFGAPVRDVMFFAQHPAERHATMRWCVTDVRHSDSPDCPNAMRAGMSPYRKD